MHPFPALAPFASGLLEVDDGAQVYWEASGNPTGIPLLYLHGGPGGGLGRGGYRRRFDPACHLIIGIDQRGCGCSRPLASEDPSSLASNTTARLLADIEAVREHLGIGAWILHGVSWGSTLALASALEHPDRTLAVALMAVTTTSRREVDWITQGVGRIFPEEWQRFSDASGRRSGERVVEAYARRLASTDPADREDRVAAADAWDRWESVHVSLDPYHEPGAHTVDPAMRLGFATLVTHYWANDAFMRGSTDEGAPDATGTGGAGEARAPEPAPVLERAGQLEGIPGILVHGRFDVSGPVETPWLLHRAWPGSELHVVEEEGHGGPLEVDLVTRRVAALVDGWEEDGRADSLRRTPGAGSPGGWPTRTVD
ncbi:alpha/beta fold hydrolase [Actinomyces polynesiensis]|uniref:alpha/beta fold hydrolase n=1 Tax=Actinomyces polynesiensis TaxID=1325934 RepID=UPI00093EB28C|nr:alpha/beta fold hydrolase [Actinomyces polynesiensis]